MKSQSLAYYLLTKLNKKRITKKYNALKMFTRFINKINQIDHCKKCVWSTIEPVKFDLQKTPLLLRNKNHIVTIDMRLIIRQAIKNSTDNN